jgi:hypothetical protein
LDGTCTATPTPQQLRQQNVPHRITPTTPTPSKWSWIVYDINKHQLVGDDNGNKRLVPVEFSVATVLLRQRIDNVGTTQQQRLSYQDEPLNRDIATAGDALDPKAEHHSMGNAAGLLVVHVGGGVYHVDWLRRAKPGAREEDFHAILDTDQDNARVSIYVTGPAAEVRHNILTSIAALYAKRPAVLDCMNANAPDSPKRATCFPSSR